MLETKISQPYTSCIKINGKPILPPLLDDDSRRLCRDLKDQAMAIETQLKEKKKSQIMEKVKTILDKCVSFDQLNISKLEPSKYRLVHIPLLKSKIGNTSLCETEDKPASPKKLSLPNSPVCDYSTEELHKEFADPKDVSISEISVLSTDLDPYMQCEETECDSTTPQASDSEDSFNLESTPLKDDRIRKLSYTLETPSPVLLRMMASDSTKNDQNNHEISNLVKADQKNGNAASPDQTTNLNSNSNLNSNTLSDSNGNISSSRQEHFFEGFLEQQQKRMQELLDQQNKEQDKLIDLFKKQEEELLVQLKGRNSSGNSLSRRNLQSSFDSIAPPCCFKSTRLAALVRGYLTRRLMNTDRVQGTIKTIRDTTLCLKELNQGTLTILPSDVDLHRRLLQQLNGAIHQLHGTFFELPTAERMSLIGRDREKKVLMITGLPLNLRPRSRSLSSATVKSLERKMLLLKQDRSCSGSSRPSSASTVQPRTSPSACSALSKRSPSSISSISSYSNSASLSSGAVNSRKPPLPNGRKPWRC